MVGGVEGQEGFGMASGFEDFAGFGEGHDVVAGGMADEQWLAEVGDCGGMVLGFQVVDEGARDWKRTAHDVDVHDAFGADATEFVSKVGGDVARVGG